MIAAGSRIDQTRVVGQPLATILLGILLQLGGLPVDVRIAQDLQIIRTPMCATPSVLRVAKTRHIP